MRRVIGLIGALGDNGNIQNGGQIQKTKTVFYAISSYLGRINVISVDTMQKNRSILIIKIVMLFVRTRKIIIMPGRNGILWLLPLFIILSKLLRVILFYLVVGG